MTDLDRLIEAVEAGKVGWYDFPELCEAVWGDGDDRPNYMGTVRDAYNGSLDAAKRLHDALLPGWEWNLVLDSATLWPKFPGDPGDYVETDMIEGNPARAWLLAILLAVKSSATSKPTV